MEKISLPIFEAFKVVLNRYPHKEAICFKKDNHYTSYTYSEIGEKVIQLSRFLINHKIKKQDRAAIILDSSPDWPIVFLSLMNIGAAAVLIDPRLESEEMLKYILHSEAKAILTSKNFYPKIKESVGDFEIEIFNLDFRETLNEIKTNPRNEMEQESISPLDLAAIIYTSGTTSAPKGVMLTHKNFSANIRSLQKTGFLTSSDCLIAALPFYHAYPLMVNLLLPLLSAAKISFPPRVEAGEIIKCIKETKVTILAGIPRLYALFYEKIRKSIANSFFIKKVLLFFLLNLSLAVRKTFGLNLAKFILKNLHSKFGKNFRFMASGGAKLNPDIARNFYKWGFTILEGYGLTETSPVAAFNLPGQCKIGSIGKPVPDVEIKINNPDKKGIGEIIIKGQNVTPGYYKDDELTRAVIKDDWFFTRDLGWQDKNGFIYITNRKDELIVLSSGKNINPGEIEARYQRSFFIEELCVFAVSDPKNLKNILAAAILPDYENLRRKRVTQIKDKIRFEIENLSHGLPPYKRIQKYIILSEKLPRTTLGKIKRYAVKEKYDLKWEETKTKDTLNNEDKELLAYPLCKKAYDYLSNKSKVKINLDDNLEIDLGLDSLEQISLFLEFQRLTGIEIQDEEIFNIFTVRDALNILCRVPPAPPRKNEPEKIPSWQEMLNSPVEEKIKQSVRLKQTKLPKIINSVFNSSLRFGFRLFFRLKIKGIENLPDKGPLIICPTHASYIDGPLIFAALKRASFLNTYLLGFKAYFDSPLIAWSKKLFRLIPIEPRLDLKESLQICSYILKNSKILCLFPEGGRSIDGNLLEFKRGLGILIKELNVPVLPVYIKGNFKAWGAHMILPRPRKITLNFGRKLTLEDLTREKKEGVDIYKNIVDNLREHFLILQQSS